MTLKLPSPEMVAFSNSPSNSPKGLPEEENGVGGESGPPTLKLQPSIASSKLAAKASSANLLFVKVKVPTSRGIS
jgi:hypothetical protein